MGELFVLDAPAFINTDLFSFASDKFMTSSSVFRELRDPRSREMAESALIGKALIIKEPSDEGLSEARKASASSGDLGSLSSADLSVLALGFDLKRGGRAFKLVTDDKAVQNVCKGSGIEFVNVAEEPIKEVISWLWICPKCKREFGSKPPFKVCKVCGVAVVKKKGDSKPA